MTFDAICYSDRKVMQPIRNYLKLFQNTFPKHIYLWH
jgi:hypothetical protein